MSQSIITQIEVDRLFNRFSYKLPSSAEFSKAAILYGDNGVGKSTILRLVFHLLSSAGNRGHRSALRGVAFKLLAVKLSTGMLFKAERQAISEKNDYADGPLTLTIEHSGKVLAEWAYSPGRKDEISYYDEIDEDVVFLGEEFKEYIQLKGISTEIFSRGDIRKLKSKLRYGRSSNDDVKRGERPYIELLDQLAPTMFYVNAERRLDSDAVADPSDELELRRAITHNEPKRINDLVNRAREIALSQAMVSASRWVQRRAVQSANQGSTNVHSVYVNVLHHLSNDYHQGSSPKSPSDFKQLIKRLEDIEVQTHRLEEYELGSGLIDQSQKMTAAAMQMAEKKVWAHRS